MILRIFKENMSTWKLTVEFVDLVRKGCKMQLIKGIINISNMDATVTSFCKFH